jgi:hypothetical protein
LRFEDGDEDEDEDGFGMGAEERTPFRDGGRR